MDDPAGGQDPRPILFIVPGLMASELEAGGRPVWIDTRALVRGDLERIEADAERVHVAEALRGIYQNIAEFLGARHEVSITPYDWRTSLQQAGRDLGIEVDRALEDSDAPVRILAHSAGGLVALSMILEAPDTWSRMVERDGSRLILAGAPTRGTMIIPQILLGTAPLVKALAHLDIHSDVHDVARMFAGFDGLLELLPGQGPDFFSGGYWQALPDEGGRLDWSFPDVEALGRARRFREALAAPPPHADRIVYVAGHAPATPAEIIVGSSEVRFRDSNRGDGVVLWDGAIPEGVRGWWAEAPHGQLLSDENIFEALRELLDDGTTESLSTEPPVSESERALTDSVTTELDRMPDWTYLACAAIGWPIPRARKGVRDPIVVTVVHGDVAAASYPVVLGHYKGDLVSSTGAALDYHLENRLARLHQLDLYPSDLGTCEIVLMPPDSQVAGAVVLGLGEHGSLSSPKLTDAVRRATLMYAERLNASGRADEISLSFVLIGTSDRSLTLASSIRSILRGVIQADQELDVRGFEGAPRVRALEIVELFRDRANEAVDALTSLCGESEFFPGSTPLVRALPLRTDDTGQRRVSIEPPTGWWDRLHISLEGDELRFTTPTARARSEDSHVSVQVDLVRQLLEQARDRKDVGLETPGTLFQLLVSQELRALIADRRDMVLVLDDGAAQFPWELLIDRFGGSGRPLSIGAGLIRSLRVEVTPPLDVARENKILVVGDPPSHWPGLPSAQREAREVARHFRGAAGDWEVTTQIEGLDSVSASSLLTKLMSDRYRILHLAGHGDYREGQPRRTGMVIGSFERRGPDPTNRGFELELLRPQEVMQMPAVPELVFINCCHLGRQEDRAEYLRDRPRLASNLASQFIQNGVRAVVAAGWEVGDRSALLFAQQFYRCMLAGDTFGDAVTEARRFVYSTRRSKDNTWGAFQCYGDPGFSLKLEADHGRSRRSRFHDAERLIAELDNVVSRSKVRSREGDTQVWLKAHLEDITRRLRIDQRWNGAVLVRLARAFGDVGLTDRAIDFYEEAREKDSGRMTLADLEQLANLRARRAVWRIGGDKTGKSAREQAVRDVEKSALELEHLLDLGATPERLSLLASAYKRLAMLSGRASQRTQALERMTESYGRASRLQPQDPYPLINALGGVVLLGGPWPDPPKRLRGLDVASTTGFERALDRGESLARTKQESSQSFWDRVHVHDLLLVRELHRRTLKDRAKTVAQGYRGLARSLGSRRELTSVRDQIAFMAGIVQRSRSRTLADLREQLPGLKILMDGLGES